MATKKKTTKMDPETKALKADVRYLGKEMSKMRVAVAQALGAASACEDKVRVMETGHKEFASKLRKLIADPIYSVPDRLKKEVEALTEKFVATNVRVSTLEQKLKEKRFKGSLAGQTADFDKLNGRVDDLESQVHALDTDLDDLKVSLGEPSATNVSYSGPDGTISKDQGQVTLDEVIEKSKSDDVSAVA